MIGDRVKQAKMIFSMIDESGDGEVNKLELIKFFASNEKEAWRKRCINELVSEMIFLVDEDQSGQLEAEEFVRKVAHDGDVWEIFEAVSPLSSLMKRLRCVQTSEASEDD